MKLIKLLIILLLLSELFATNYEEALLWVHQNIQYKKDIFSDYWQSPEETLKRKKGDCEDQAILLQSIIKGSKLVCGYFGNMIDPYTKHVWVEFQNYILDATVSDKPIPLPNKNYIVTVGSLKYLERKLKR